MYSTVQCTVYGVQGGHQPGPGHRGQCPGVLQAAGEEDAGGGQEGQEEDASRQECRI